jgi:hypothetical protein
MLQWSYVGSGSWELQGGVLLGCYYGAKDPDQKDFQSIAIEKVCCGAGGTVSYEQIFKLGPANFEYKEAMMLVEAHMERILRRDVQQLQHNQL